MGKTKKRLQAEAHALVDTDDDDEGFTVDSIHEYDTSDGLGDIYDSIHEYDTSDDDRRPVLAFPNPPKCLSTFITAKTKNRRQAEAHALMDSDEDDPKMNADAIVGHDSKDKDASTLRASTTGKTKKRRHAEAHALLDTDDEDEGASGP
jgi:hypothetical protein